MDKEKLEKKLDKIGRLPSLPSVARRVIEVANDPKSTVRQLSDVVSLDPMLTTKALRLVNSAFYGFPREIETLTQAFVLLGFNTVRNLALGISMLDYFSGLNKNTKINLIEFWRHSLGVSILSRELAHRSTPTLAEEVFIAGLLHDVSMLVIEQSFALERDLTIEKQQALRKPNHIIEKEVAGWDHAELAGLIFRHWNFPENMCAAIEMHHNPVPEAKGFRTAALVHAADIGVKLMKIGDVGDNDYVRMGQMNEKVRILLRLSDDFAEKLKPTIEEHVRQAERNLSIS